MTDWKYTEMIGFDYDSNFCVQSANAYWSEWQNESFDSSTEIHRQQRRFSRRAH